MQGGKIVHRKSDRSLVGFHFLAFLLVTGLSPLTAQGLFAPKEFLFWEKGELIRVDEKLNVTREFDSRITPSGSLRFPAGNVANLQRVDGDWLVTTFSHSEEGKTTRLLRSADGKSWESLGFHQFQGMPKSENPPFHEAFFLGGNQVLLKYGSLKPIIDGKTSPLVLGRITSRSNLVPVELIDLELPDGFGGPAASMFSGMENVPVAGGIALIKERIGYIWAFYREGEGIKQRKIKLYPNLDPVFSKNETTVIPVLCVQPTREGRILVAARSEGAVLASPPPDPMPPPPVVAGMSPKERVAAAQEASKAWIEKRSKNSLEAHWKTYPELFWFEVDPRAGSVRRVHPPGAPDKLQAPPPFRFSMSASGWVRCPGALPEASATPLKSPAGSGVRATKKGKS